MDTQNQVAQLVAAAEQDFNKKVAQMSAGGDTALVEAKSQVEELTAKVRGSAAAYM